MGGTTLNTTRKISIAPAAIVLGLFLILATALVDNGIYLSACFLTAVSIGYFLWKDTRPAVLVFAMLMQWVQVVAFPIWMDDFGWDINRLSNHAGAAVFMACAGMIVMCAT